jgi:uncharacterized protein YndB with AHSA1/START domain/predicted enzyme related to lactoylglutathione lyase
MENKSVPTLANGKICYVELPTLDVNRSTDFCKAVFGWRVRTRDDGSIAFNDSAGEVSGSWVTGRKPATDPGVMVYMMVDSIAAECETIIANGGKIVQATGGDAPETTARFTDPAGNVLGLCQTPLRFSPPDREIVNTGAITAPRELDWNAWSDPEHLAQWWGPDGFTNTIQEFDQKLGGHWRFVMHGPDGKDYKNHVVFLEVTKPGWIAYDHISGPRFCAVVTFEEVADQTKVTFRQIFQSTGECEQWKPIRIPANEQNLDRLETELKKMS